MINNLRENMKNKLLDKFLKFNSLFLGKFTKEVSDAFRLKNDRRQYKELIKLENIDLITSPSKLFEGKDLPQTSETKSFKDPHFFSMANHKKQGHSVKGFNNLGIGFNNPQPADMLERSNQKSVNENLSRKKSFGDLGFKNHSSPLCSDQKGTYLGKRINDENENIFSLDHVRKQRKLSMMEEDNEAVSGAQMLEFQHGEEELISQSGLNFVERRRAESGGCFERTDSRGISGISQADSFDEGFNNNPNFPNHNSHMSGLSMTQVDMNIKREDQSFKEGGK